MKPTVQQGVILAAGRGTRLQPLSDIGPKPLQPICNKPIMQYQMEAMRAVGIHEIAIVINDSGQPIRDYFGDGQWLDLHITYIEDPAPAGIASSLMCAESWVRGPMAVFLGDIFLAIDDLTPAIAPLETGAAGTIVVRRDTPEAVKRNFVVLADAAGRVEKVIEKPKNPTTDVKGCGVYVFDQSIFEAIRQTPRSALRNEFEITDAVQIWVDMGRPVFAADVVRWDVNITFPEDLLACNMRLLKEQALDSLVGREVSLNAETHLVSSIVGDRAVIDAPVTLEKCLVLSDVHIGDLRGVVRQHIFLKGLTWSAADAQVV